MGARLEAENMRSLPYAFFDSSPTNKGVGEVVWKYLDTKDFQRINRVCSRSRNLKFKKEVSINWSNVKMTYSRANAILSGFEKEKCHVISMKLTSIRMEVNDQLQLMKRITHVNTLNKLDLADTYTSIRCLPDLTKLPLTHLNLSSNFIMDSEIQDLQVPSSLIRLDLYANLITADSLGHLESLGLPECNLDAEEISEDDLRSFYVRSRYLQRIKTMEGNISPSDMDSVIKISRLITAYEGGFFISLASRCKDAYQALSTRFSNNFMDFYVL
jgi:hypothetical protein